MKTQKRDIFVILHNIRSLHNVGSMFRTADAAGVTKVYLTGYTPVPLDVFGKPRSDIVKTALGAEKTVAWEQQKRVTDVIAGLRRNGVFVIALEQDANSVDYRNINMRFPFALVVGNEVRGLSKQIRKQCDVVAEIPMRGKKESLNVSVAFGIALFRLVS